MRLREARMAKFVNRAAAMLTQKRDLPEDGSDEDGETETKSDGRSEGDKDRAKKIKTLLSSLARGKEHAGMFMINVKVKDPEYQAEEPDVEERQSSKDTPGVKINSDVGRSTVGGLSLKVRTKKEMQSIYDEAIAEGGNSVRKHFYDDIDEGYVEQTADEKYGPSEHVDGKEESKEDASKETEKKPQLCHFFKKGTCKKGDSPEVRHEPRTGPAAKCATSTDAAVKAGSRVGSRHTGALQLGSSMLQSL